ncbi:MAG TPA: hypothetical protein DCQ90_06600 [Erysipelotrichaceae bacterium]|nr:hypothetical protein [Erysipelotrichaceae bacterium]
MREPKPKKDKNGVYHIRFRIKSKDGKVYQKHFSKSEWRTGKDAVNYYNQWMKDEGLSTSGINIDDLNRMYLKDTPLKQSTYDNRVLVYNKYIFPVFEKVVADKIEVKDIRRWQNELLKMKSKKGKEFRDGYLKAIQDHFRAILNYGVKLGYVNRSPFAITNAKRGNERKIIRHYTPDEFTQFVNAVDKQIYADFYTFLYWTGMRAGEVIALTDGDIDLTSGTISVTKSFYHAKKIVIPTPKSKNSFRTVVMTSEVKRIAERIINEHSKSYKYSKKAILFGFDQHLIISTLQFALERYSKRGGVHRINLHGFRHSHVYMLRKMGFNPFEIAKRIGDDIIEVNNTYGQWFDEGQREMVKQIDDMRNYALKIDENDDYVANVLQKEVGKA